MSEIGQIPTSAYKLAGMPRSGTDVSPSMTPYLSAVNGTHYSPFSPSVAAGAIVVNRSSGQFMVAVFTSTS